MAHPGRPRGRMNKKTLQAQAELARAQQAQAQAQMQAQRAAAAGQLAPGGNGGGIPPPNGQSQHSAKEETLGVQLHDEADLISFRNDALFRYITNYEYIENVTSKLIHTSKIIPPSLYPMIPKPNTSGDYENLKPEDIYFGDLSAMKYIEKKLITKLEQMEKNLDPNYSKYLLNDERFQYHREKTKKLAELQENLTDKESLNTLELELEQILNDYKTRFNKNYKETPSIYQYSISIDKIDPLVEVNSAPENYNPKLINSFINIGGDTNSSQNNINGNMPSQNNNGAVSEMGNFNNIDNGVDDDALGGFQFSNNIDTSKFNGINGMAINQFGNNFEVPMNNKPDAININNNNKILTNKSDSDGNIENNNSNSRSNTPSNINTNNINSQGPSENISSINHNTSNSIPNYSTNGSDNDNIEQDDINIDDEGDNIINNDDDNNNIVGPNRIDNDENDNNNDSNGLDMNQLFEDNAHADLDHLEMVNDDIGDLYNFETGGGDDDDDNGLMDGLEFEQDFLN